MTEPGIEKCAVTGKQRHETRRAAKEHKGSQSAASAGDRARRSVFWCSFCAGYHIGRSR